MSRKASERRLNPDAFVEANLWVVTRGRRYKPRFRAERAVVIVSGGVSSSRAEHTRDPPRHPLATVVGAADAAAAIFEENACDAVYVLDFGPLRGDVPAELASPYPGRVAKSVARLLLRLNVSDALLAASGVDVAVLLKVLSSAAENTRAVVLHEPDAAAPAAVFAGVRAAAADGAARRLEENLRIRYAPAERAPRARFENGFGSDDGVSVRSLLAAAFPDADATDDPTDANPEPEREETTKKSDARRRFAAAAAAAARALEARDDVPPPPAWLASSDTPVFCARVTFEHDKVSKQIQQVARDVTDAVAAARASAAEEETAETEDSGPGAETLGATDDAASDEGGDDAEAEANDEGGPASSGLCFGGEVGVFRPEAFVVPAKGAPETKPFPEGAGCFYPKMPCLECGSPWWVGDDWDALCANCGGDAESYDDDQKPYQPYRRRYARFRELIEALRGAKVARRR